MNNEEEFYERQSVKKDMISVESLQEKILDSVVSKSNILKSTDKKKFKNKYRGFRLYSPKYNFDGNEELLLLDRLVKSMLDSIISDVFKSYNLSGDYDFSNHKEFIDNLGLIEYFKAELLDEYIYGYGCIGIERDNEGFIDSVYHVNSKNVRILENEDEEGFIFVEKVFMSKDREYINFGDNNPEGKPELIFIREYNPLDDAYGVSPFLPVLGDIELLKYLKGNYGGIIKTYARPQIVGTLESLDDTHLRKLNETADEIERRLNDSRGELNSVILSLKYSGLKLNFQQIKNEIDLQGLIELENSLENSIMSSVSMSPYRLSIIKEGQLGGTNIDGSLNVYGNNVVLNKQRIYEKIIMSILKETRIFKDIDFVFSLERFKMTSKDVLVEDAKKNKSEIDKDSSINNIDV